MWFDVLTQVIGVIAMIAFALSYQMKTQRNIVLFQLTGGAIFAVHYLMLGSLTGFCLNLVGAMRCAVYSQRGKKWADSVIWVIFFGLLAVGVSFVTRETFWDYLPAMAMVLSGVALYITNVKMIRILSLLVSPMWLVYSVVQSSLGSFLNEIFTLTSVIVAMIRLDFRKKPKDQENAQVVD